MLRQHIGQSVERLLSSTARFLHTHHITPNMLTITGLIINVFAAVTYSAGYIRTGGIIILAAGLFDMLDGAVARSGNTVSKLGAFIDSVVDRYSDLFIFGGILVFYAAQHNVPYTLLTLAVISGAYLTSYIRARAELVIPVCAVGLMERPERIILLAAGSFFSLLPATLWILALTTHLTAFHRIIYTIRKSGA